MKSSIWKNHRRSHQNMQHSQRACQARCRQVNPELRSTVWVQGEPFSRERSRNNFPQRGLSIWNSIPHMSVETPFFSSSQIEWLIDLSTKEYGDGAQMALREKISHDDNEWRRRFKGLHLSLFIICYTTLLEGSMVSSRDIAWRKWIWCYICAWHLRCSPFNSGRLFYSNLVPRY